MNNVKSIAVANDGSMVRIAVTYDVINDDGVVVEPNKKLNRIVTDAKVLDAIGEVNAYAKIIVDETES